MAKMLSVFWKNHSSELATAYKSLWENNLLVDCTLSAEGRTLKAHRLVLSACSPYFQMLFYEETEKHPFVILLNASFETLKAVIDFVYQGQTQIPEGNLKSFLRLAQTLEIKGLNGLTENDINEGRSGNTAVNAPRDPFEDKQDTFKVHGVQRIRPGSFSQLLSRPLNAKPRNISDLIAANEGQSSVIKERQIPVGCSEVSEGTEITLKHESLLSGVLETRKKRLIDVKSNKTETPSFQSKTDGSTSLTFGEQDLNQSSSGCGISDGNVEPSVVTPPQQQLVQLNSKGSSDTVVVELQPLLPEIMDFQSEQTIDAEIEELLSDHDVPGNDINEMNEESEPEQTLQHSSADPLEEDLATQQRSLPGQQSESSPPHTELQLHEGPHAHPGEQTVLSDEGGMAVAHVPSTSTQKPKRKRPTCKLCNKVFASASKLDNHVCSHTGKLYHCDVCGKLFASSSTLDSHVCSPRKRLHHCDVCDKSFAQKRLFVLHQRTHLGNIPYFCTVCEKEFSSSGELTSHMKTHMKTHMTSEAKTRVGPRRRERRHQCTECGKKYTHPSHLTTHIRVHTGERPYRCEVCGHGFAQKSNLESHKRSHTGERPYRCDVCGKRFSYLSGLWSHKRYHTGERPYRCEVCGMGFVKTNDLVIHARRHTGERPYLCHVCGKDFALKDSLRQHSNRHTGERPFGCNMCSKAFTHRGPLSSHKRNCHAEQTVSAREQTDTESAREQTQSME